MSGKSLADKGKQPATLRQLVIFPGNSARSPAGHTKAFYGPSISAFVQRPAEHQDSKAKSRPSTRATTSMHGKKSTSALSAWNNIQNCCSACQAEFPTFDKLRSHQQRRDCHDRELCTHCGACFANFRLCRQHEKRMHSLECAKELEKR
ncbi:hypothetical protein WA026_022059 [Henosepilachna vigintioctopunctata]|uniref:C2H2-type domain-containing protein n=1 Tax=Henosepilachna vigintioctopunctata TaxID=420089 RepID=A0AAW1UCT4_9CUCU